ncbi:MAG TPA: hypothetical protein VEK39_07095 [Solirubrobacterales bacterium]|nr:hypothetical protein [Solirubrobacterales bacterium]
MAVTGLPRNILRLVLIALGALAVGFGVPLLWIWIGSVIQGSTGKSSVNSSTAAVIFVGIIFTYLALMFFVGWIQARFADSGEQTARKPTRHPWNRSMRDEPYRPGERALSPLETMFVATAIVASIAFMLWFFLFAGSPLPQGG